MRFSDFAPDAYTLTENVGSRVAFLSIRGISSCVPH
jgi:hypothetical protein